MTIRGLVTIVVLLAALLYVNSAHAQDVAVARLGTTVLTLTDQRAGCDWAASAKRARILLEGKEFLGCYVVIDKEVYIQWDDGDRDQVSASEFTPTV
jgi:hypothetical protein